MELTLLEPDVATLISRGDSLVLQVQTSDLERALRINATTGDLRAARAALKAGNEVSCYCRHCLRDFSFLTTRRPLFIGQTQLANFASKQMATNSRHADCTLIIQKNRKSAQDGTIRLSILLVESAFQSVQTSWAHLDPLAAALVRFVDDFSQK